MLFAQHHFARPRADRIVATCHDGVIAVSLSRIISRCLCVGSGSRLKIAHGSKPGQIILAKGRGYTSTTVELYQNGSEVAFNLRAAFLPIELRDGYAVLNHSWHDTETIVLDFFPLSLEQQPYGRSRRH